MDKNIPSFYRSSAIDILMFGHLVALHGLIIKVKRNGEFQFLRNPSANPQPGITLESAFEDWKRCYGIKYDDYNFESGMKVYHRMMNKFHYVKIRDALDSSIKTV